MKLHPLKVICGYCTDPLALFPVIHVPGPPCLECGKNLEIEGDITNEWYCTKCKMYTVMDTGL